MWGIYVWILISHEKEGHPVICDNRAGAWEHYAKCNKSDKKGKYCRSCLHTEFRN